MRSIPKCEERGVSDIEVMSVILFGGSEEEIAKEIGVSHSRFRRWVRGVETTPSWAYRLLRFLRGYELPPAWGEWAGTRLIKGRLVPPGYEFPEGITVRDLQDMRYYRLCTQLVESQANLIERLTKERNFYKQQCARESRFGLMVNRIFK